MCNDGEGNTVSGVIISESFTGPAESETLCMRGHSMHENREISAVPVKDVVWWVGQGRPVAYNPDMYAAEKSDIGILPVKVPNKVGKPTAEVLEERPDGQGEPV